MAAGLGIESVQRALVAVSAFCVGVITSPCSNSLGTYTDFAGPQFLVVGNHPSLR
jgi:hypothetical protein